MITMPLIGVSLMLYLIIKTRLQSKFHKLIFTGLVLSLAGDVQLLFTTEIDSNLLSALVAILLAYLMYSIAYYLDFKRNFNASKVVGTRLLIILSISLITFYFSAGRNLEGFLFPALAYLMMLSAMVALSGYRYKRVNKLSYKLILTGSMAFLLSDLAIAYNLFIDQSKNMMLVFLTAYLIAQYLVVIGSVERKPYIIQ